MCWCDPICEQLGDCCDDKIDLCGRDAHHGTGMSFPTGSGMPEQFPMPGSGMPMPKPGKPNKVP